MMVLNMQGYEVGRVLQVEGTAHGKAVFWDRNWVSVAGAHGGDRRQKRQLSECQAEAATETLVKPLEGLKSLKVLKQRSIVWS